MQHPHFNKLHNKHAGETCIVIGNGPSLRNVPDSFLNKYPTFGSNRIYLRFVPTYYVVINPLVIENNRADIEALDTTKFVRANSGLTGYELTKGLQESFSYDPPTWINEGYSVTYVSLQLAFYMGFKRVLLVGVDHRYAFTGEPNETQLVFSDPNHFDPNYFVGQTWQTPDLVKSEAYYFRALVTYTANDRFIYNLTEGTALDTFVKGDLNEWM